MNVTIKDKKENALLSRTELLFEVEGAKIPPVRKELREKIAALENTKLELVIVSKIGHGFGSNKISGTAHIYASVEDLKKAELPHMIARHGAKKKEGEKKAEEAPAAPAAAEAKEEKTEGKEKKEEPAEKKEETPAEKKEGEQ